MQSRLQQSISGRNKSIKPPSRGFFCCAKLNAFDNLHYHKHETARKCYNGIGAGVLRGTPGRGLGVLCGAGAGVGCLRRRDPPPPPPPPPPPLPPPPRGVGTGSTGRRNG